MPNKHLVTSLIIASLVLTVISFQREYAHKEAIGKTAKIAYNIGCLEGVYNIFANWNRGVDSTFFTTYCRNATMDKNEADLVDLIEKIQTDKMESELGIGGG